MSVTIAYNARYTRPLSLTVSWPIAHPSQETIKREDPLSTYARTRDHIRTLKILRSISEFGGLTMKTSE